MMKRFILFVFLCTNFVQSGFSQTSEIVGNRDKTRQIFSAVDITGTSPDSSNWIPVGEFEFFVYYLNIYLNPDSVKWATTLGGDSLDLHLLKYSLHGDFASVPDKNELGFVDPNEANLDTVITITIADTTRSQIRYRIPLHGSNDYALDGEHWVQFILVKGTKQVRGAGKFLKEDDHLWLQP